MVTKLRSSVVLWAEITADGKLLGDAMTVTPPNTTAGTLPGGADAVRALLEARLANELRLTVHARIDGRRGAPSLSGSWVADFFPASIECRLVGMEALGDKCVLRYRIARGRTSRTANG